MLRNTLLLVLTVIAVASAWVYAGGPLFTVYHRVDAWETSPHVVCLRLRCGSETVTLSATRYYGFSKPYKAVESPVNLGPFEAVYKAHDGPCHLARVGYPVRVFSGYRRLACSAPRWALAVATLTFGVYPMGAFLNGPVKRWRRRRRGRCEACGYDLTGAPTMFCSECGHSSLRHTRHPAARGKARDSIVSAAPLRDSKPLD